MAHDALPDPFAPINRAVSDLEDFIGEIQETFEGAAPANPLRPLEQASKNAETTLQEVTALPTLIIVCAWCNLTLSPGIGPDISHGICEPCQQLFFPGVV